MSKPRRSIPRRILGLCTRLVGMLLLSILIAEGLVRGMLFEGWFTANAAVADLRRPRNFAHYNETTFQELKVRLRTSTAMPEPNKFDPVIGWLNSFVRPEDHDHRDRRRVGRQRPVLLFGDSFAAGVVEPEGLFQSVFEETHLGPTMELINYGAGGYGLDQICLLAERALPRWTEQRPVVLMSFLLDDDMDRCRLEARPWPKPRFQFDGDELVLERPQLPTTAEHMDSAFSPFDSWAWRLMLHANVLPNPLAERLCGEAEADEHVRRLSTRLLEDNIALLKESGLPFGFVLFHSLRSFRNPELLEWREDMATELLEAHGVPYVLSRHRVAGDQDRTGLPNSHYFITEGLGRNHLTSAGNRVAVKDLVELVERVTVDEQPPWIPPLENLSLASYDATSLGSSRAAVEYFEGLGQLSMRVSAKGPTEAHYRLEEPRLVQAAIWMPHDEARAEAGAEPPGSVDLSFHLDGELLYERRIERLDPVHRLNLSVPSAGQLVIRAGDAGDGARGDLVILKDVRTRRDGETPPD